MLFLFVYSCSMISGSNFSSSKNKKLCPKGISYISGKWNPEKFCYIFFKKSFSYFSWNGNLEKFFIFQERHIQNLSITELFYILGNVYSKPWYNRTFIYFGKGICRTLVYLELEEHSEPWYIQNTVKHLRWSVLQK